MGDSYKGFTLIELLVTILVAAIFLTAAVPSYYSFIQNNKVVSITNRLSASFSFARSEAVKRGVTVSVCPVANANYTACGTNWQQGWIVFTDADGNNAIDTPTDLVKIGEALPSGMVITASNTMVSYDGTGFTTTNALTMTIKATGCTGFNARTINIATSGRLSVGVIPCN